MYFNGYTWTFHSQRTQNTSSCAFHTPSLLYLLPAMSKLPTLAQKCSNTYSTPKNMFRCVSKSDLCKILKITWVLSHFKLFTELIRYRGTRWVLYPLPVIETILL